jgi:oligogalacturonide lyase
MNSSRFRLLAFVLAGAVGAATARAADPLPRSWVDADTGHRIVQLSTEPGSASLYFTQYAYTANGTKLLMTSRKGIDLVTIATGEIEHVMDGPTSRVLQTGRKTGAIFYTKDGYVCSLDPVTKVSRQLAKLPPGGSVVTVNSDETLAAGSITESDAPAVGANRGGRGAGARAGGRGGVDPASLKEGEVQKGGDNYPDKHAMMDRRLAARTPMTMFTVNLQTGEYKQLLHTTDWINHFQFSPTDPLMLLYAHEGRQWKVDRVWLIRADGKSQPKLVHQRTMKMEIAVHEYWSNDGQWVYYDLQTPLSEDCWVASYNVNTEERVWYHVPANHWSVHYNTSPDNSLISGDGSDPELHYARAQDAKWMFLFHPELVPNEEGETADQAHMVQAAKLVPERLVNLNKHDYSLEPNGNFSPDGKWVIFRSNMRGPIQVYAVEVAKAK